MSDIRKYKQLMESVDTNEVSIEDRIRNHLLREFENAVRYKFSKEIMIGKDTFSLNMVDNDGEDVSLTYMNDKNHTITISMDIDRLEINDEEQSSQSDSKVVINLIAEVSFKTYFETEDGKIEITGLTASDSYGLLTQKESYLGRSWDNILDYKSEREIVSELSEIFTMMDAYLTDTSYDIKNYVKMFYN
jgi:hypothetical protein